MKIAIVSHILPPSPSGQAVVLYRLLRTLSPDKYCLISRESYESVAFSNLSSGKLPARFFLLNPVFQLPVYRRFHLAGVTICLNALWAIFRRAFQIKDIAQKEKSRLIIACTGDLNDLPAAYLASRWIGIPFIPYMFDDYLYQWTGIRRTIARFFEPYLLNHARAVIVPNEYMQQEYFSRYSIDSVVIHNPCEVIDKAINDGSATVFNGQETVIVYTGSVYHAHYDAFRNLLEALNHIGRNDVRLHIFTAQSESELGQQGIFGPHIVYHPQIPQSDVPVVLHQADILFLPLAFESPIPEVIKTSSPGKTGEYLASGRSILVHAPQDSFLSLYFKKHACGIVVDRNDPALLAEELKKLIENKQLQTELGRRARKRAEIDFSIESISVKFIQLIGALVAQKNPDVRCKKC